MNRGMNLGYTGKAYDVTTGMYNYGYRDYSPEVARFTTVDPIRDGANWFAYVNNDPVKWVDLWGLSASDKKGLGEILSDFFSDTKNSIQQTVTNIWGSMTSFQFEERDAKNVDLPTYDSIAGKKTEWIQLPPELSVLHDNKEKSPEIKFIHPDGREVVYTKDFSSDGSYQVYTDPQYKGTFNYVTPANFPDPVKDITDVPRYLLQGADFLIKGAGHVTADVLPYYIVGKRNERDQ
jgi:RHS repeat-associated protein